MSMAGVMENRVAWAFSSISHEQAFMKYPDSANPSISGLTVYSR